MSSSSSSTANNPSEFWQDQPAEPKLSKMTSFARDFYNSATSVPADLRAAAVDTADGDDMGEMLIEFQGLTMKQARSTYRMALLTPSQWTIVMENCGMPLDADGIIDARRDTDKLLRRVMNWRRSRGEFDDDDDDGEDVCGVDYEQVPRQLCDDMQGADERNLMEDYLKTDLQVECLLRGISYEGSDSKASLISKLLNYKDNSCLNQNSFVTLAQECQ